MSTGSHTKWWLAALGAMGLALALSIAAPPSHTCGLSRDGRIADSLFVRQTVFLGLAEINRDHDKATNPP